MVSAAKIPCRREPPRENSDVLAEYRDRTRLPRTWICLIDLLRACIAAARGVSADDVLYDDALAVLDAQLLRDPHAGCAHRTALARRRRLRLEIAPHTVHRWFAAALQATLPKAKALDPETFAGGRGRSDDEGRLSDSPRIAIDSDQLRALLPRSGRLAESVAEIEAAATELERTSEDVKQRSAARGRGGKRVASRVDARRVAEWLEHHPRIHRFADAAFVYERVDEIIGRLDALARRGDLDRVARPTSVAMHHLAVLERWADRRMLTERVARMVLTSPGEHSIPIEAIQVAVEGWGWCLFREGAFETLERDLLRSDVLARVLSDDPSRTRDTRTPRAAAIARAAALRTEALARLQSSRRPDSATDTIVGLRRAADLAKTAGHESLQISIALDTARALSTQGDLMAARNLLFRAASFAREKDNTHREIQVRLQLADLEASAESPENAADQRTHVGALLRIVRLECNALVPTRTGEPWYRPSLEQRWREATGVRTLPSEALDAKADFGLPTPALRTR